MSLGFRITFIVLCIAAIFITGIPLAKYLSNQYFELRRELNSHSINSKYSSHENLQPAAENLKFQNGNQNTLFLYENAKQTEIQLRSKDVTVSSLLKSTKLKKRSKRRAPSQHNKENLSWNFNLNVTRYPNPNLQKSQNSSEVPNKNRHLEVAFYAKGQAEKPKALDELQNTLKRVETFIRGFFENKIENVTYQFMEMDQSVPRLHFETESLTQTDEGITQNIDTVQINTEENEKRPVNQKGREGKFILEFLGFGGQSPTTTLSEDSVSTENENSSFRKNDESLESRNSSETGFVSENPQEVTDFHSEAFMSETNIPPDFEAVGSISQFNLQETTEQNDCMDCITEEFELSESTSEATEMMNNVISEMVHTTETFFTDEVLEQFCMSLVNKLEEAQQSDEEAIDFELNTQDENQLRSSKHSSVLDLLTLFNSLKEETNTNSAVIEDSFLVGDESRLQTPVGRQSRFLNFPNIFGSGRSAILEDESNDLVPSSPSALTIDIENLPSILDCENYFGKKQSIKMFPKPNLVDMMSDPKIQLEDFANATISPKLKEQQLQFLTDLLKTSLNNSVEAFDSNLGDQVKHPESDEDENFKEENVIINEEHIVTEGKEVSLTESNNWNQFIDKNTKNGEEFNPVTQIQRNGRFFPIFRPGSGSDENLGLEDSRLIFNRFSSGERSLETTDTAVISTQIQEFGSGEAFEDTDARIFDDVQTFGVSEDILEGFGTTSVQERIFSGLLGLDGSGNGRELIESVNVKSEVTTFPNDCMGDCFLETSEKSHDCNDCNSKILHNNNTGFTGDVATNETALNTKPINFDEHFIAKNLHETHENCNCIETDLVRNANFSECGECSSIFPEPTDSNLEILASSQFKEVTSVQVHRNDCGDCDHESDLYITNKTISNSDLAVSECDDCNYNITETTEESYKVENGEDFSEDVNETLLIKNFVCLECNYENDYSENQTEKIIPVETLNPIFSEANVVIETRFGNKPVTSPVQESSNYTADVEENSVTETPDHHKQLTTEVHPRFFGFLTGSGDGSVFGDNGGPINLVEEEGIVSLRIENHREGRRLYDVEENNIMSPVVFPRRRGRLDDIEDEEPCDDCNIDVNEPFEQKFNKDDIEESCDDCNVDLNELFGEKLNESEQIYIERDVVSRAPTPSEKVIVNETETSSSDILPSTDVEVSKPSKLQPRFCTSASQCNSTLNERCITIDLSAVCGCDRGYVRHKETSKCVVKRVVETSLRFPAEKFDEDLNNPLSPRYRQMKKNALDTMWLLLRDKPELLSIISEVDISKFREGSLIVSWNLVFAVVTESEAKLIKNAEVDLQNALKDEKLIQKASLDVSNASVLAYVSEINPCQSSELNYCSKNAYCVWNEAIRGRFACYCKEHYRDDSSNPLYRGETCIAKCPPEYCGPNGHCEILENGDRFCMCSGLYFGRRCDVPGMYVLGILVLVASISIVAVFIVACKKRCSRSYGGSQAFSRSQETSTHTNDRVSDAIALEENTVSGITKYANISTPTVPVIMVTQPSIHESSISFDGDSTFNVTPTSINNSEQKTAI